MEVLVDGCFWLLGCVDCIVKIEECCVLLDVLECVLCEDIEVDDVCVLVLFG